MLTPRLTNCPECADIPNLLKKIDCKLAEYANGLYNNVVFMLNQVVPAGAMIQLLAYKRILTYKQCNPDYLSDFCMDKIVSKVIRLTLDCYIKPTVTETLIPATTSTTSTSTTCPPLICSFDGTGVSSCSFTGTVHKVTTIPASSTTTTTSSTSTPTTTSTTSTLTSTSTTTTTTTTLNCSFTVSAQEVQTVTFDQELYRESDGTLYGTLTVVRPVRFKAFAELFNPGNAQIQFFCTGFAPTIGIINNDEYTVAYSNPSSIVTAGTYNYEMIVNIAPDDGFTAGCGVTYEEA
jgi:hypothetical protein